MKTFISFFIIVINSCLSTSAQYFEGYFNGIGADTAIGSGYWLFSKDSSGVIFTKLDEYGSVVSNFSYGTGIGGGAAFKPTNDSGLIFITDSFSSPSFVGKTDAQGNLVFSKKIDGSIEFPVIIQSADSSFLIAAYLWRPLSNYLALIKINSAGDTVWSNMINSLPYSPPKVILRELRNGDLLIGCHNDGSSSYGIMLCRYNSNGNLLWANQYMTNDLKYIGDCAEDQNGNLVLIGGNIWGATAQYYNMIFCKTDGSGNILDQWQGLDLIGRNIAIRNGNISFTCEDTLGNNYLMNLDSTYQLINSFSVPFGFSGSFQLGRDSGYFFCNNTTTREIIMINANQSGTLGCLGNGIPLIRDTLNLTVTPLSFVRNSGFGYQDVTLPLTSSVNTFHVDCIISGLENDEENSFSIYPNPFTDFIKIKSDNLVQINFELYNSLSQLVMAKTVHSSDMIDTGEIQKGFYFYKIISYGKLFSGILLK